MRLKVLDLPVQGHVRTPGYLRGRVGEVVVVSGAYADPNKLARGEVGVPYRMLYRMAFDQHDLWPDYPGSRKDRLIADIYEHWLQPADETTHEHA
jgi:nitrile hydratase